VPKYYPVMLDIRGRLAIVIGGDRIAAEKAAALLASGATVRVISGEFSAEMLALEASGQITFCQKDYVTGDLAGAFVVVAAINDEQTLEAIWQETLQRGQPVNIVDVPRYCSFILPSILRRGQLTVAVSTEGAAPALAKRIRQQLEEVLPSAYGVYIDLAALVRRYLRQQGVSYAVRDAFFADFMASSVLALLENGESGQALTVTAEILRAYGVEIQADELEREFLKGQEYAASKV
jgi:precorrin-2 dehydrogenase/sirohydrochlorin ferrochelatase